jgi:PAS domain S-box-containing protein
MKYTPVQKISNMKRYFTAPVFPNHPEKTRKAGQLNIIINSGLASILVFALLELFAPASALASREAILLLVLAMLFGIGRLNHRGRVQLASWVLLLVISVGLNLSVIDTGGVGAAGFAVNILIIVLVGMLLGLRTALGYAAIISFFGLGLAWAESANLLHFQQNISPISIWIFQTISFLFTVGILRVAINGMRMSLDDALRELAERNKMNEALRASEARQRALLDVIPELVFRIRRDGVFMDYHTPDAGQLMLTPDLFMGQLVMAVMPPEIAEQTVQAMEQVLQTSQPTDFEYSLVVHGQVRNYDARMVVSGPDEVLATVRDITERKQMETEREKLIVELEKRNVELEQFIYTVSHDLKTPLVTIRGFLGYLERDVLLGKLEPVQADIARITSATNRMQRLLSELLDLSRIGRTMNPPQAVPFETIVREAIDLMHGRLVERGVQIEITPGLPTVYGDRTRLVEVTQNLLDNAVKFMGDQPEPRIEIGQAGEVDGKLIFFVKDNGIGIAPEFHSKIFGLFNKLDMQSEGTGVGLTLVKRIVEAHGGHIWVESQAGLRGATFYFTLPPL